MTTTAQDLKDAADRYNRWTHSNATIYKSPGGWYHLTSPDFTPIVSAPTRETLENAISAQVDGYINGTQAAEKKAADRLQIVLITLADILLRLDKHPAENRGFYFTARLSDSDQAHREILTIPALDFTAAQGIAQKLADALQTIVNYAEITNSWTPTEHTARPTE